MSTDTVILVLHALTAGAMGGLIWFVQIVHYPLFARVGEDRYIAYQLTHVRRTGYVVMPLMLVELGAAIAVAARGLAEPMLASTGLALIALVWVSTFALQVPCHRRLERGFDSAVHRRLVATNWIRTLAWSARAVIAVLMLVDHAQPSTEI